MYLFDLSEGYQALKNLPDVLTSQGEPLYKSP